jgi:hypothetical protein
MKQICNLWYQSIARPLRAEKVSIGQPGCPRFYAKRQSRPEGGLSLNMALQENSGAGEGIRTLDPDLGKVVLYH